MFRRTGPGQTRCRGSLACWWTWSVILVLLLASCGSSGPGVSVGITEGHRAPDFDLEALDGSQVSLGEYRGQVVLINFWATWCEPCRAELPALEAVYQARREDGFAVLGVNSQETREAIAPFVTIMGVSFTILIDESGRVQKTYRPVGLPMSVLVDREGIIQVRHLGPLTEEQLQEYLAALLP